MDSALQDDLRKQLEEERDTERARLDGASPVEDGKSVHNIERSEAGMADAGEQIRQRSERLGEIDHTESRLDKIEAALGKMDEGTYGTCDVCGDGISEDRLRALPLATRCIEHADEPEDGTTPAGRVEG